MFLFAFAAVAKVSCKPGLWLVARAKKVREPQRSFSCSAAAPGLLLISMRVPSDFHTRYFLYDLPILSFHAHFAARHR